MIYMFKKIIFSLIISSVIVNIYGQTRKVKFGDVTKEDLAMKVYDKEKDASAVVIFEHGDVDVHANYEVALDYKYHVRIKILKKSGLDFANIQIPMFAEDRITNIQASTFNLLGNEIIESKISKKNVYFQKLSNSFIIVKFAFTNVQEGSIIEYSYKKTAKQINFLEPWYFQREIPVIESEFYASISQYFKYKFFIKGDLSILKPEDFINKSKFGDGTFHWLAKNIPAFREESLMPSVSDYILQLNFELSEVDFPGYKKEISPSYGSLTKRLLDDSDFGEVLKNSDYLVKYTKEIIKNQDSYLERAKGIYRFVSNKILWDGNMSIYASQTLKKTLKKERGNSADINFTLIAMLRQAGIETDPVVLSTRSNGKLNPYLAEINKLNYVVARANIDSKIYYIDATDPLRPFYLLPFECLNDSGRIINEKRAGWANLRNDEQFATSTNMVLKLQDNSVIKGKVRKTYKSYSALGLRNKLETKSLDDYNIEMNWEYPNWHIDSLRLENTDSIYQDINELYNVSITDAYQKTSKYIILNPLFLLAKAENPFREIDRKFPVSFGCQRDEKSNIVIEIPKGSQMLFQPKDAKILLPNNAGSFEYKIVLASNYLMVNYKLKISRTEFTNDEYSLLKEFYDHIVKKQNEVVFITTNN